MVITVKQMETPEEIEGKSLVHWQTWREAYDDLLPPEFQETMMFTGKRGERLMTIFCLQNFRRL